MRRLTRYFGVRPTTARSGAVGVIVADNQALRGEPLAFCPDYSQPHHKDASTQKWLPCTSAIHGTDCFCGDDHSVAAEPIPSAPQCSLAQAEYQATCDPTAKDSANKPITGPCWFCKASGNGGQEMYFHASCFAVPPSAQSRSCQLEQLVPFMADDGDGGDITVPSFIISDYNAQLLKHAIKDRADKDEQPLKVVMSWAIKQTSRVEYEFWTSCEDSNGAEFSVTSGGA